MIFIQLPLLTNENKLYYWTSFHHSNSIRWSLIEIFFQVLLFHPFLFYFFFYFFAPHCLAGISLYLFLHKATLIYNCSRLIFVLSPIFKIIHFILLLVIFIPFCFEVSRINFFIVFHQALIFHISSFLWSLSAFIFGKIFDFTGIFTYFAHIIVGFFKLLCILFYFFLLILLFHRFFLLSLWQ